MNDICQWNHKIPLTIADEIRKTTGSQQFIKNFMSSLLSSDIQELMDFITCYRYMQSKTLLAKNKKEILPHKINVDCS